MRCNSLTALFFALFALFSSGLHLQGSELTSFSDLLTLLAALAYAAPVAPQGEMNKRQCQWAGCRYTEPVSVDQGRLGPVCDELTNV